MRLLRLTASLAVCVSCTAGLIVTDAGSSATKPAGTDLIVIDGVTHFVSMTTDPLGPFSGQSVHFEGYNSGGSSEVLLDVIQRHLVFRYLLQYDAPVQITSLLFEGAAFNSSQFRILDANMSPLWSLKWTSGGNFFQQVSLTLTGVSGTTFYLEEWDTSTFYRYRSLITVGTVPEPRQWGAFMRWVLRPCVSRDTAAGAQRVLSVVWPNMLVN